jgi:hypothetical protein
MVTVQNIRMYSGQTYAKTVMLRPYITINTYVHTFTQLLGAKDSKNGYKTKTHSFTQMLGVKDKLSKGGTIRIRSFTNKIGGKDSLTTRIATRIRTMTTQKLGGKDSLSHYKSKIHSFIQLIGSKDNQTHYKTKTHSYIQEVGCKDSLSLRLHAHIHSFIVSVGIHDMSIRTINRSRQFLVKTGIIQRLHVLVNGISHRWKWLQHPKVKVNNESD